MKSQIGVFSILGVLVPLAGGDMPAADSEEQLKEMAQYSTETGGAVHLSSGEAESMISELVGSGEIVAVEDESISASCVSWQNAVALVTGFMTSTGTCYVMGGANSTINYEWQKDSNASGTLCASVMGFTMLGTSPSPYWRTAGCGTSGATHVAWRNSAAYPKLEHRASSAPGLGVGFSWRGGVF